MGKSRIMMAEVGIIAITAFVMLSPFLSPAVLYTESAELPAAEQIAPPIDDTSMQVSGSWSSSSSASSTILTAGAGSNEFSFKDQVSLSAAQGSTIEIQGDKIISMHCTTSKDGGKFTFGDNKVLENIPAGTSIDYKDGIITINSQNKEFVLNGQKINTLDSPSLKLFSEKTYLFSKYQGNFIEGDSFKVGDTTITSGSVSVEKTGLILLEGTASVDSEKMTVSKTIGSMTPGKYLTGSVFLTNLDESQIPEAYREHCVSYTANKLTMTGTAALTLQPGSRWADINEGQSVSYAIVDGKIEKTMSATAISFPNPTDFSMIAYKNGDVGFSFDPREIYLPSLAINGESAVAENFVYKSKRGTEYAFNVVGSGITGCAEPQASPLLGKVTGQSGNRCMSVNCQKPSKQGSAVKSGQASASAQSSEAEDVKPVIDYVKANPTLSGTMTINGFHTTVDVFKKGDYEIKVIENVGSVWKAETREWTYFYYDLGNDGLVDASVIVPGRISDYPKNQQIRMNPDMEILSAIGEGKLSQTEVDLEASMIEMKGAKTNYDDRTVIFVDNKNKLVNFYSFKNGGESIEGDDTQYNEANGINPNILDKIKEEIAK